MKRLFIAAALCLALSSCASGPRMSGADEFYLTQLWRLCGNAYEGRVVTNDAADAQFASQRLVMHVRECNEGDGWESEVRIPFHVGENRSRTWVITRVATGLRLKHDHRHEDGSEDTLTQYGGDTLQGDGSAERVEFPADEFSKQLFRENNIPVSVDNVWAMELHPGRMFAYELRRPNRHFRVEFDLTRPVPAPPPPWGAD
jgi:hypothetical protein